MEKSGILKIKRKEFVILKKEFYRNIHKKINTEFSRIWRILKWNFQIIKAVNGVVYLTMTSQWVLHGNLAAQ